MASSIVDRRRRNLRRRGDPRADLPDAAIAQMLQVEIEARGELIDDYAAKYGDTEFPTLVREAYGEDKGYLDQFSAIPQSLEGKKSGLKKGAAVGLGSIGMDETAEDLMRSASKNDREAARVGKDVFNRLDMVDSFEDAVKYVQAGLLQAPADILPGVATAVITRGAGSKVQKALEKSGKAKDLRKKAEKYLGKDYGANAGMATGAVGSSVLENTGHVYGDLYEYTKLDPEDEMYLSPSEARAISLVAGGASGALDSALPIFLVNKLSKVIGKAPAEKEVGKFFSSMPEGMVLLAQGAAQEGATEALQEVVQMLAVKYHTDEEWTDQDWNRMINGGVLGAIGGGGITGATGGIAKLLEPKYREPSEDGEYTDNFEKLKTDEERIELRNRYIDNKFSSLEIGSVVSPTGSGRLARVVETDEENKELIIEYPGGTTERVGVTEVSIKEDAKKVIRPEEFKYLSEDKLKDLKEMRPNLATDIDKELERRKGEKDEDTLEVEQTMLVAKSRGNQVTVADSSSGEQVMSGVITEDNGVLTLLSEDFSGSTDERKTEAQDLLRNQVRRKATEKGMLVSIDGVVEYELPPEAVYAMDDDELLNEFGKIQRLQDKHANNPSVIASLEFAQAPLLEEMVNADLITVVDGKVQMTEPNIENSKFLKNNRGLGGLIGFRAFQQVEGDLDKITASTPSGKITEKFIQDHAKQYVELITEGVDGITKADVNKIAKSAAVKFSEKYLKDKKWPEKTEFDYQIELDLKQEEEQAKQQSATDRFDSLAPEAGKFAKMKNKDGEEFYYKITEVDDEKKTIKVADLGDNSISLSDVLSVTEDYKTERGDLRGVQGNGVFRTKLLVVGKDTDGIKKGKSSVEIIADDNDKITSLKSGDKIYDVSDNELSLETDRDELKKEIALLVLPDANKAPTRVPVVDFGQGIKLSKDGIKVKPAIIKSGDGRTAREVEPVVKIVNKKAVVTGVKYNGNEYPFAEGNYEPGAWKEGARQLLLKENLFPEKNITPRKSATEIAIEKEAGFTEFDEDLSVVNRDRNIMPTAVRQEEYREQIDQIEDESGAVKFLKGFKDILTNSTDTKVAVVLKYFRGDNEPIYLVRNLRKNDTGSVVIANMNKQGSSKNGILTPLSDNRGGLKVNLDEPLFAAFYDNESGAFGEDIEGRLEIEDIIAFRQNVKISKNFANKEAYENAIGSYEDFVQIRSKKLSELKDWYEGEIEGTERQDDVYSLIHDGEDYNPLFEIYTESIPADILKQYRDRIVSDLVNDKETKAHEQLSHLKKKGVPLRIKDVLFVEDSTRVDQSTFTSRLAEENEQFAQVQRVIRKYREKDGLVQKGENTEVAQVAVGDDVLENLDTSDAIEETNEIRFDEPKVEESDTEVAEDDAQDEKPEEVAVPQNIEEAPAEVQQPQPEVEGLDQDLIDRLEPIIDTLSDPDPARLLIQQYKDGETNADELTQSLFQMIQKDQEAQQESVGEIAGTEAALNREIQRHKNELRTPPINNVPLGQDLVQENEAGVQNFLGGAQMDGEPIKLSAYLQRIVMLEPGATNLDGSILDMAQTLLAHPFARNLKVKFESWENFKKGVSNDGSNGKLTRAYLRGDTIVMGPFYKLSSDSDLTADNALQVTFLEEVAHRVLGTAVEVALQTKKNNQLPKGASKAISKEQAIKLYDQTKELMDWLKGETDGQYYHGLLNMHEFWANFASNPRFRKFLNRPMPPAMRRKFSSKFERVIDWILDLASKIFDADFTANRTALDVIRKEYRTLLRTSDKLAKADLDIYAKIQLYHESQARRSTQIPVPLPLEVQSASEGTTEEAAARIARGSLQAGGRDKAGFQVEEQALRAWAEENDLMLDAEEFDSKVSDKGGMEHEIYYDESKGIWVKANDLFNHSSYLEYFNRLQISNFLFPAAPMRLKGFIERDGMLMPVVHQVHVKGSRPTETEIRKFFEDNGFRKVASPTRENDYENDLFEITDAHDENLKKLPNGQLVVIDVVPFHKESISNTGTSSKFKQFLKAPKLTREEIEAMGGQFESADEIGSDDQDVTVSVMRAHQAALKDLEQVVGNALKSVDPDDIRMTKERLGEFMLVDGSTTPKVIADVLNKREKLLVEEIQQRFQQSVAPEVQKGLEGVNTINDLETTALRDTGARNLYNLLVGMQANNSAKSYEAKKSIDVLTDKLDDAKEKLARLTKPKSMFDVSKTKNVLSGAFQRLMYNNTDRKGEVSQVNAVEISKGLNPTPFSKLRDMKFDTEKLFSILDSIADGVGEVRFVEQLTSDEIFDLIDVKASDVGIDDSDMDQAVQMAISIMLGSDQNQPMARSAFTAQLRLAKGRVGTSVDEAVRLIKAAAQGKDTPDVKDKSMMSILRSVRKIKEQIDEYEDDLSKYRDEYQVAGNFLEAINDRIADLDEYFNASMPLDLYEGNEYTTLITNNAGEIEEFKFTFTTGNGESSEEAKYVAARASQLMQIMQTDEYKEKYANSPMDRYFKKLAREMAKVNFGIKYQVANDGFIHSAMLSLQERFSKLGAPGKLVAEMLNKYTRDYQAEVGVIYNQGKRVSRRLKTLHGLMSKNENLNQFIQHFGSRLFDWFNERPDLAGQEEMAINKVWKHLKETDNTRNYTDDAKKALRAFLKDWSIQNENFQRIYRKYDVAVEDEDVIRGYSDDGEREYLRRRFVDQGVYTSPRRMNLTRLTRAYNAMYTGQSATNTITTKMGAILDAAQNAKQNPNFEESFTQAVGKIVDQDAAELFFRPLFSSNSVHTLPFTLKVTLDDKVTKRIITPEELDRAWRNAEGNSPGIRVANAIQNLAKIIPDSNVDTLLDLLNQFGTRDIALTKAWQETTKSEKKAETLSELLTGNRLSSSVHNRALYGVLPGEFFEYQMYDETSSGQILSSILMSSNFGENGDKVRGNFDAIRARFEKSYQLYEYISEEIGLPLKGESMPSKTNKIAFLARKKRMIEAMARAGIKEDFDTLDLEARAFVEARRSMAALNAMLTSPTSDSEDIGLGLEVLRAISFGTVNTMKGAWTSTMSIPDIGKRLGLNATSMKTIFGAYKNVAQEISGSLLESFGVEMVRPDKYAKYLNDVFGREAGMTDFADNITEIGVRGSLGKTQGAIRRLKSIINGLSVVGAGARSKTSGNFIPASILTPITAPFTYLAQATNKSISLSMANTIESFVLKAVDALDAKNVPLNDNLTELKPSDLGYEDSTLDQFVFGNMEMVESLNQRLTAEGMSITQLAQKYRNRKEMDPDAEVLDRDAVLAAHNIAMSEVTYDTMAGKGTWSQHGVGQFLSPLVGWSVSSYAKGMGQMRNKEGQIAMRNVIRYMLTTSAWLLPAGIAFTLFTDWWDEEILGKPSSLRKTPFTSALPIIGLPLAMTDPRFDALAVLERAARANNILGIAQEFVSPILIGQLDPSNMQRFDPTRRVLAISSVMNTVQAATNYLNAIKTSNKDLEDFVPDYATVVRPLMYSMGLNSVIQNAQAITNLTDIEEYDPTGFLSNERRVTDITGMRNDLRVFSKVLGMEMRSGGLFTYTSTAMGNAMKLMERAAYANDKKAFKDAYRKAIRLSESSDPKKDVITKFKQRHIRYNITRFTLSDADLTGMLSVMDDDNRKAIRMAIRNHEYYLRSIGGVPTVRKNNTRQYEEKLRRLAL